MELSQKNILVAPLNWGLGHATRCIPVIQALEANGFNPIIASDGIALELLKLEFPHLQFLVLPSYKITYPKDGKKFKLKMILNFPNMLSAIYKERKSVQKWVKHYHLCGVISDNRLGVFASQVPSVFITHQLNVLSGSTTFFSTILHQNFINKFTECWVPDVEEKVNLSGKLGHSSEVKKKVKYIGPLSRFRKIETPVKYDMMVLLSGPEPQRTLLEEKLIVELQNYNGKTLFVKGIVAEKQVVFEENNILFYNFMQSADLQQAINESSFVLSRSGYTTVMDLAKLRKKAFFIPTPGQFEQEYLAQKFQKEGLVPFCNQDDFTLDKLEEVNKHKGLLHFENQVSWKQLFGLFKCE